ncbi:MAG: S-layer homology domain-containing protein [Acidimicrobiaceae bacterium]|nr:S-layer homology domain-containing protein [Acidimicrobiaceae bacterium]
MAAWHTERRGSRTRAAARGWTVAAATRTAAHRRTVAAEAAATRTAAHRRAVAATTRGAGRGLATAVVAAAITAATMGLASTAAAQSGFTDTGSSFHRADIETLTQMGLFEGTECADEQFCPNDPAKRWAVAVWLVRALDGDDPPPLDESRFADVDDNEWWMPHVERLAQRGVTAGCRTDPLRFCPDGTVNRGQMASFLVRAFDLDEAPPAGFEDTAGTTHEANIDRLFASGITVGCNEDPLRFCPNQPVSRAQMATFIVRGLAHLDEAAEANEADTVRDRFTIPEGPRGDDTLISAGRDRTCAVRLDGTVACWGANSLLHRFALAGLRNVAAVSTGDNPDGQGHVCVLHTDGTISCWGPAGSGQLGQGDPNRHYLPVKVPGITDAVAVSAGAGHTCAVHRDGSVSCWGSNYLGQLGDGTKRTSYSPQQVPGLSDAVTITASSNINCVLHRDGDISCWGWPYTKEDSDTVFRRISDPDGFTSVSVGWGYVCAATVSGHVDCWPHGWAPENGRRIPNMTDVVEVSAGNDNVCGLHSDGGVSCAGRNDAGEIGDGTTDYRDRATRLAGITDAVAVSLAVGDPDESPHACALHADGSAWCWGSNGAGQLGDGTNTNRLVPTRVDPVATIPADQVPLTPTGLLQTWGDALVQQHEADYPWTRVAWDYVRDRSLVAQSGFGGLVWRQCYASRGEFGCEAIEMHITEMSEDVFVHELLHVYDLHHGLAPSRAWGAVQLYFATTYPGCWSDGDISGAEVLADTVSHVMVPGAWLTYYNSEGCETLPVPSEPTAEAEQVVLQGMAGRVPDWYSDNITGGAELWAAWLRGPSLPALANLAGEFGGLCSTDWITYPLDPEQFPPSNPFKDSGC